MSETTTPTLPVVALARKNDEFRDVTRTEEKMQLVLTGISEGGEIDGEGHDRWLYFVAGIGVAKIGNVENDVGILHSGAFRDICNTGSGMLKLFTTCYPPGHEPGAEHATKSDADE